MGVCGVVDHRHEDHYEEDGEGPQNPKDRRRYHKRYLAMLVCEAPRPRPFQLHDPMESLQAQ